mmetsp:Transcript_31880/g.32500  ORF Transcript_31880/g.32500 Transcript_31880/m.32500 type:complete len:310 (+) Transcript_31880:167-1096(+)
MTIVDVISPVDGVLKILSCGTGKSLRIGDKIAEITIQINGHAPVFVPVISPYAGVIDKILVDNGRMVCKGQPLVIVTECSHPALFKNLCVSCGERITVARDGPNHTENRLTFSGGHTLVLSQTEAISVQTAKISGLRQMRKLALILDLDNTLMHASVYVPDRVATGLHIISFEDHGGVSRYCIKLRPHVHTFLSRLQGYYQFYIYTHGTRPYARRIAALLDPEDRLFGSRILTRTDLPDLSGKSLQRLFLGDLSMALILDDREDVWAGQQRRHLWTIQPYVFFNDAWEKKKEKDRRIMQRERERERERK